MNTPQPPLPTDNRALIRAEGQLFQSLLAHWIHEDQLYWTQVRHLLVLELAVFGALFSLNVSNLTAILMFVAAVVAWYLFALAEVIRQNRDSNVETIAVVSKIVASTETQESVKSLLGTDDYNKWGTLRIARHDLEDVTDAGKRFQQKIFSCCIVLNIVLGVVVIHDLSSEDHWLQRLHPHFGHSLDCGSEARQGVPAR